MTFERSTNGRLRAASRTRERRPASEVVGQSLLTFVVIASPLAIGSVHTGTILVGAMLTAVAAALTLDGVKPRWRELVRSPMGIGLALAALCFLQAVPLPVSWLRHLAPSNADVWSRSLLPFGDERPSWASISLDPGASAVEATKWLTYVAAFTCAMFVARRRGRTWGIIIVFLSGIVTALVTVGHGLAGATKVYGFYEPRFVPAPWHVGPLLNSNNLAGYLNLSAMCGLGLLLSRQRTLPRWLTALGTTVVVAVVVIAASRGGFLALLAGLLLLSIWLAVADRETAGSALPKRRAILLLLAATAGGALFAVLGSTRETWAELYDTSLLKVRMLGWTKPMILDHFWLGVGRGAFESVFPAYRIYPEHIVFTHAENFPAQWMVEWGVPVAVAAFLGFGWCLRPAATGTRRSILAGSVAVGISILLLQNLFDLGLEVPSICIALAVAFGSIWGGWDRTSRLARATRANDEDSGRYQAWMLVAAMASAVALSIAVFDGLNDVAQDRDDRYQSFQAWVPNRSIAGRDAIRNDLRAAMKRHPADPYFPLLLSEILWLGTPRENPLPALARSLERASQNGRAHLLLAEILTVGGALSQARLELRLAVIDEPSLVGTAAPLAIKAATSLDQLMETVPAAGAGVAMLDALSARAEAAMSLPLLQELLKRDPVHAAARGRLAEHYLFELGKGNASTLCRGDNTAKCKSVFEESVLAIERTYPKRSLADRYRARLLVAEGKPELAEALLAARCPAVEDIVPCQQERVSAAAALLRDSEPFHRAARDLQQVACATADECAATAVSIGDMLVARGEWGSALGYYRRACKDAPTESRWIRLADAASNVGSHSQAADALENAVRLHGPPAAELRARLDMERSHAMGLVRE